MPDDAADRARDRLELLDAMLAALERRDEVLATIADAEDAEAAVAHVRGLLGVSEWAAHAVLNLQWRRLTRTERARMAQERDVVAQHLARTT